APTFKAVHASAGNVAAPATATGHACTDSRRQPSSANPQASSTATTPGPRNTTAAAPMTRYTAARAPRTLVRPSATPACTTTATTAAAAPAPTARIHSGGDSP